MFTLSHRGFSYVKWDYIWPGTGVKFRTILLLPQETWPLDPRLLREIRVSVWIRGPQTHPKSHVSCLSLNLVLTRVRNKVTLGNGPEFDPMVLLRYRPQLSRSAFILKTTVPSFPFSRPSGLSLINPFPPSPTKDIVDPPVRVLRKNSVRHIQTLTGRIFFR